MAFREVSNQSWGSRIMSSFGGAVIGVLMFLASFVVLWWNEGRCVQTAESLEEGAKAVVSVDADKVDPTNNDKLVHITAKAVTDDTPTDADFSVKAPKDLRLMRKVEMYQYKEDEHTETKKNLGGSETTIKTYTYPKVWSEEVIPSDWKDPDFTGKNPTTMPYKSATWWANKVTVGAFVLSKDLLEQIHETKKLPMAPTSGSDAPKGDAPDKDATKDTDESKGDAPKDGAAKDEGPAAAAVTPKLPPGYKVVNGDIYKGTAPDSPQIGDLHTSYQVVEPTTVSVLAQQKGDSFQPYQTKRGDALDRLDVGSLSADQMFQKAQEENNTLTWILRLVGFVLMGVGIFLVFRPLAILGDVVPFIGSMVGGALAFVAALIALGLSLITIAIAWVFYRPIIGIPLLVLGVGALGLVLYFAIKRKKAPAVEARA